MPVAATHAESHLDRGVGVPPGVGAKEDAMPVKWGPPLPPDDPIFSRASIVFFPESRPATGERSEEAGKSDESTEKPPKRKRSRRRGKQR
jgi:hypothetical protein